MNKMHLLYEKMKFPIEVIFVGCILLGIGNIFTNPVFGLTDVISNDWIEAVNEVMMRTGRFIITNFPLVLLLGLVSSKKHETAPIAALTGYASFLLATAFFSRDETIPSSAYSSVLGISVTGSAVSWLSGMTRYPLQTGVFGASAVGGITVFTYRRLEKSRQKNILISSRSGSAVVLTIVFSFLAGVGFTYIWPYVLKAVAFLLTFISRDTSNSFKLGVYGFFERVLTVSGLGTLIRQPFWFGTNGGSWSNISGQVITGDVSIWTAKLSQSTSLYGTTGRFITPYYLLNIFAIPGMLCGMYSIETNKKERRKKRIFVLLGILASALCGTLLPMELTMMMLSPLLFVCHLFMVGLLYHLLNAAGIYLGFQTSSSLTQAALPGTLSELLSYTSDPQLADVVLKLVLIGAVLFFVYVFITRFYFRKLALGLFDAPGESALVDKIIHAVGGINNVMDVQASVSDLRIQVYDISTVDAQALQDSGASGIYEDASNCVSLHYGGAGWMLRKDILDKRRSLIREIS